MINTQWVELSGVARPDISVWQFVVMGVAMLMLIVPIWVWKDRWFRAWRWWKSVLFFVVWFCVVLPVGALVAGGIIGDTYAKTEADGVVAQVLAGSPAGVSNPTRVVVAPSDHAAGAVLDVPYQGDSIDYQVDFAGTAAAGRTVQCHVTVSLYRQKAPRGRAAPVLARMSGGCR